MWPHKGLGGGHVKYFTYFHCFRTHLGISMVEYMYKQHI